MKVCFLSGEFCEKKAEKKGLSGGEIAAIVICVLAFIGMIVAALFLYRFLRRSRKLHGKYNPAREEMTGAAGPPLPLAPMSREERLI